MKTKSGLVDVLIVLLLAAFAVWAFAPRANAQDQGWLVERADYGHRNQRNDVTDLIQDLISRGGVNGRVAVNNQTMGGDPAPGTDKSLRIFARSRRGEAREFDYKEGGSVDISIFVVAARGDDWDDRHGDRDDRGRPNDGRGDLNGLWIIRAYYGVQRQQANVTDLLRSMLRGPALEVSVDNRSMGGDPAPGADKVLIVIYRYQGREAAAAVNEGHTLSLP